MFPGRIAIQQRVLPEYRVPFFEHLARACRDGLALFAGEPAPWEGIRASDAPPCDPVRFHKVQNRHLLHGRATWQPGFRQWLSAERPDAVIVEANPRMLSTYGGIRQLRHQGIPVIGWGLGFLEWDSPGLIVSVRQRLLARFIRQFDASLAYSSHGGKGYVRLGARPDAVFVAHNAISNLTAEAILRRVDTDPRIVTKWKQENGFSEKPIVLSLGRLVSEKKVDELMRACTALADRCDLMIIGDGPDLERLRGLAAGGMPNVKLMGYQTGERLGYCVAAADLFVLPGSGGLAVQEAMSYGKPVIASLSDGTQKDLIEDGKNGFMFQSGDFATMRELIARCLEDRDGLTAMGQQSRRIVAQRFSFDAMQDSFLNAVEFAKARVAASR